MFKVAAVPPRRFAMLTVFRATTAINDGTSAEPRRSWRYHCGLCRTNTAVAPRPRCDGDIMSAVLTICRGFTAINDETTAEPRRAWRWHCGVCRTSTAVAPRLRCDGGITNRLLLCDAISFLFDFVRMNYIRDDSDAPRTTARSFTL